MDQQPNRSNPPTPEEIARLEAEAVRAMQQGEPLPAAPSAPPEPEPAPEAAPDWDNVPYVDAVEPAQGPDTPDEDGEYVPGDMERRIAAIPEDKWRLYTTLGGAALGLLSIAILILGSEDLGTWSVVLAALLALVAPRYAERWWRRPMPRARIAMLIAMVAALAVFFMVTGLRTGFTLFDRK